MKVRGRVQRVRVAAGSKNEHEAAVMEVAGRRLRLRRKGGTPFADPKLLALAGRHIVAVGEPLGHSFMLDRWELEEEQHMSTRRRKSADSAPTDPFRHVVLLMMENRSFDHMLGDLAQNWPGGELDGLPVGAPPRWNADDAGNRYDQTPGAAARVNPDVNHDVDNVAVQLKDGNSGFVRDYQAPPARAKGDQLREVMRVHGRSTLPALHTLADNFAVCDAWFSSVPGPTWPNRLFVMSGTSRGRVKMPQGIFNPNIHSYSQPSVFKRLAEAKRPYGIYFGDFPLALLLADQRKFGAARKFHGMSKFFKAAAGPAPAFPDFAFIEPDYMGSGASDDHPSHDVMNGQRFLAEVYRAIRSNQELWETTLLVITYDEHGGFYDHVPPGPATAPDEHHEEYDFRRLGVRVPAVLVSPWIERQVVKTPFDHTSVLAYLRRKWSLGDLGKRAEAATPILEGVRLAASVRTDAPKTLPVPAAPAKAAPRAMRAAAKAAAQAETLTTHQQAILAFSSYLDSKSKPRSRAKAAAHMKLRLADQARQHEGTESAAQVAARRARRFLEGNGGAP